MKTHSRRTHTLVIAIISAIGISNSHAVLTLISTSIPVVGETGDFSDGTSDYFGVVTGGQIAGTTFSPNQTTPGDGALAGRDIDDNATRPTTRTAEWSLPLPSGAVAPMTSIMFSGAIAARDVATTGTGAWDNDAVAANDDFVIFELFLDGALTDARYFRPNGPDGTFNLSLALDTDNNGIGDGTPVSPGAAQPFTINGTTANSTIIVRLTTHADSANEEFWVTGTLDAEVDIVPEPSSAAMLGLAAGLLAFRRKK